MAYVGGFYVFLIGSKVGLALVLFREGLILLGVMGP